MAESRYKTRDFRITPHRFSIKKHLVSKCNICNAFFLTKLGSRLLLKLQVQRSIKDWRYANNNFQQKFWWSNSLYRSVSFLYSFQILILYLKLLSKISLFLSFLVEADVQVPTLSGIVQRKIDGSHNLKVRK